MPPRSEKKKWRQQLERSGFLLCAILFHLILFLMVATLVIWKAPSPPPTDVFHGVQVKVPPPPPPPLPSSSGAAANNPQFEPQSIVVPVVTPPSIITSQNSLSFNEEASKAMEHAMSHSSDQVAQGSGLFSNGSGTEGAGTGNGFGSFTGEGGELTGDFYDFKQTSDKQATDMDLDKYLTFLSKYVSQDWDNSLLVPYYKSKKPLYTSAFAIYTRPSEEAPAAFGLQDEVQPGLWIVLYHAKVEAPEAGDYQLVGFADNVLVVKIKGETVFDGGWDSVTHKTFLGKSLPFAMPSYIPSAGGGSLPEGPHDPHLKIGPTFHLDVAEPVDMDVLIGDCGGTCCFFLLIEKAGKTYETAPDGTPLLPFFQIGNRAAPTFSNDQEHPPYSTTPEPWKGLDN
jgi:hypothetical protein